MRQDNLHNVLTNNQEITAIKTHKDNRNFYEVYLSNDCITKHRIKFDNLLREKKGYDSCYRT